jgi:hypothetical protein
MVAAIVLSTNLFKTNGCLFRVKIDTLPEEFSEDTRPVAAAWQAIMVSKKEFCNASLEAVRESHSDNQQCFSSNQNYSTESSGDGRTRSYRLVRVPSCLS